MRYGQGRGGRPWRRLRALVLKRDLHLCQRCKRAGRIKAASEVDHIIPLSKDGTDDVSNLEGICSPCHAVKTAEDMGIKLVVAVDVDGWPAR